jgi:hypothetical protein
MHFSIVICYHLERLSCIIHTATLNTNLASVDTVLSATTDLVNFSRNSCEVSPSVDKLTQKRQRIRNASEWLKTVPLNPPISLQTAFSYSRNKNLCKFIKSRTLLVQGITETLK